MTAAIERDPMVACDECGEEHRYLEYWQERYVDGRDWEPREVAWLCDDCIETAKQEYDRYQKRRANESITRWCGSHE